MLVEILQNTTKWRSFKQTKIGASDAPVIMGDSPWKTPRDLFEEKLGLRAPSITTSYMQRGIDLEPKARECFEKMTGIYVMPKTMVSDEIEWMMASLDGIDFEGENIVEIKCPGKKDHSTALKGEIPKKYKAQLQHQMKVCELEKMFYFSFDGEEGIVLEVERDDEYLEILIENERKFWEILCQGKEKQLFSL